MALSRRQILDKVYGEVEIVQAAVEKGQREISRLVADQPKNIQALAKSEFTKAVYGDRYAKKTQAEAPQLRTAGSQSA